MCRPDNGSADPARQAEAVYEAMLEALASEGAGAEAIVSEMAFFRRIRRDFEVVRSARSRVLGGARGCGASTTFIEQPPLCDAPFEVSAVAILPHSPDAMSVHDVTRATGCSCECCREGARARVVRVAEQTYLYAGNIYAPGREPLDEAREMFRVADGLLADAGFSFSDVMRTWIHLRDIDRDYDALNRARREFFEHSGLERRPASTGVQGIPFPQSHNFSMSLYAVKSPRPLDVRPMSTPSMSEAWTYGADFSRGLRVTEGNRVALYVSGTASIDEAGQTIHIGDFEAQVDRMLHNISSVLAQQGATFANLVSGIAYLANPHDAPALRSLFKQRGFEGFPCALVESGLCRPDLRFEAEVTAILPLPAAGA